MRLSDIKGERVFDVLADIIDPIANIATDPEAMELFKKVKKADIPDGVAPTEFVANRLRKAIPALLKGHKRDIIAILAALEGVEPDKYAETLTLQSLFDGVAGMMADPAIAGLFTQAQTGTASGSARENTTAP